MATKKKNTLNEDVDLLNEGEKASETPATLVSPSPDQEYNVAGAKLSPNPAKSGFTSQRVVDALPATGEYNVIYIVPIKNNGGIIGYRKWRWDVETSSYKRVYGSIPNLALGNGQRETPTIVSNPNRKSTKVYNEDVVFNGTVKIGGKTIEDYVDSEGGVTQAELENAIKAEKDIISQIKVIYDAQEEKTTFVFPKGIVPILAYFSYMDETMYFDYQQLNVKNDIGNWYGNSNIFCVEGQVCVSFEGMEDFEFTEDDMVYYALFNGQPDDGSMFGNWYAILNPKGTQLYKHNLTIRPSGGAYMTVYVIATSASKITMQGTTSRPTSNGTIIYAYVDTAPSSPCIMGSSNKLDSIVTTEPGNVVNYSFIGATISDDVVTEL